MALLSPLLFITFSTMLINPIDSSLSPKFYSWLHETYGNILADRLLRSDLGYEGSFGGGNHTACEKTKNKPVIFVHGITKNAHIFAPLRMYFIEKGYSLEELYGTTYGDAGITNIFLDTMKCDYVKQIREMIQVVSAYTCSQVNIIAYSMGSPITRKAILGGKCVDNLSVNLGYPLTELIDTFLSVAGVNYGSHLCILPFGSCNTENGMHCLSKFLSDINSKKHYEGHYLLTLYSKDDEKVGYYSCGKIVSSIDGEDGSTMLTGMDHTDVFRKTFEQQFNLITEHHP